MSKSETVLRKKLKELEEEIDAAVSVHLKTLLLAERRVILDLLSDYPLEPTTDMSTLDMMKGK